MRKVINFLKRIFTRTFFLLFTCFCILSIFIYWDWFGKQYDKALGMYYVYKGDKAFRHVKLQDAIENYNKGLQLYPEHSKAWYNLGNIYVVYEDYYSAADSYEKSIEYKKNFTQAKMNLGIVLAEKLGDFNGAIDQYESIIKQKNRLWFIPFVYKNIKSEKTNKGLAFFNMGVAYRQKSIYQDRDIKSVNDLKNAIDAYKKASKILKNNYNVTYNTALAYHLMGNYQDAGKNYCRAIDIEPMNYEAHYNLAILLRHLKMYREAYDEIEKATILVTNGLTNSNTASYIFNMLNDVSRILVANDDYYYLVEKIDDKPTGDGITYVNGKIVASDALDRAMLENFKKCSAKDIFKD